MNKLGINFENVLSIKEELNLNVLDTLSKLKNIGISSLDVKYERLIGESSYVKDILVSGMNIGSIFTFCPLYQQNNVQKALEMVDFATEYKIKEIMFIADIVQGGYSEEQRANLKQNLRRIVKYAEPFGVSIGIENVGNPNSPIRNVEETLDILKSVKGLKLIFDGGNYLLYDVSPKLAVQSVAPYVQRLHLKDRAYREIEGYYIEKTASNKPSCIVALGEGDSDVKETFEVIKNYYNGVPLVLEFPFLESNIYQKVEKSAYYVLTELLNEN